MESQLIHQAAKRIPEDNPLSHRRRALKKDRIAVLGTLGQAIHEQILVMTGHIPMITVQLMQQKSGNFAHIHFVSQ
ncbi:MAG: hypothetical protein ACLQU3_26760 [Limisphaerales bacterium]